MNDFTHLDETLDKNYSLLRQKIRKAIREEHSKSKNIGNQKSQNDLEYLLI